MSVPFYNLLFNLEIDQGGTEPIYLQLTARIAEVIRSGKIQPGAPMPGTRTLARALKISRNAAIAAYGELSNQGWIQTEVGFGTRVALTLPVFDLSPGPTPRILASRCGFPLPEAPATEFAVPAARVDLRDPACDARLLPEAELARSFRPPIAKLHRQHPGSRHPFGSLEARECLAESLTERRALPVDADDLLLVGGTQEALGLAARCLFPPGSRIAVEDPGNPRAWAAFRRAGLVPVPVPVDAEGLQPEALEDLCVAERPRALYLTPNCQWPTGAILSAERRAAVIELAALYRMAILEDDHAAELYYEERSWRPLIADDHRGVVLHIGTFEHILGPAFGLGYVTGPRDALHAMAEARAEEGAPNLDLLSGAIRDQITSGGFLRHMRKARAAYRARRDLLQDFLEGAAQGTFRARPPASGLACWLEGEAGTLETWRAKVEAMGFAVRPGSHWRFSAEPGDSAGLLLPFAHLNEGELRSALALMQRALPKASPSPNPTRTALAAANAGTSASA